AVRAAWARALAGCATTLGFGPRYLHSTGQLHKGGPNTGLFLVVTADDEEDAEIPEMGISFGRLKRAQARGDMRALLARGRRVAASDSVFLTSGRRGEYHAPLQARESGMRTTAAQRRTERASGMPSAVVFVTLVLWVTRRLT